MVTARRQFEHYRWDGRLGVVVTRFGIVGIELDGSSVRFDFVYDGQHWNRTISPWPARPVINVPRYLATQARRFARDVAEGVAQ